MHVSYSVLREGARPTAGGVPADQDWIKLRGLLAEAEQSGWDRISVVSVLAELQRELILGNTMDGLARTGGRG